MAPALVSLGNQAADRRHLRTDVPLTRAMVGQGERTQSREAEFLDRQEGAKRAFEAPRARVSGM
jgi:hypothetical protein